MRPTLSALRFFATNGRARSAGSHLWLRLGTALFAFLVAAACATDKALADEDGESFWIPGFFGSLAAVPQQPGWSLTSILYNTNVSASGNAAVAREITIGRFNPKINISVNANVHADATIGFVAPTYVFATPFLGGQASATLLVGYGNNDTSLNATATASLAPISIRHEVRCAPARHDGFYRPDSNVHRSLECRRQ
jgi:hypothetical protein